MDVASDAEEKEAIDQLNTVAHVTGLGFRTVVVTRGSHPNSLISRLQNGLV